MKVSTVLTAVMFSTAATAAPLNCDRYALSKRLPVSFQEIASAQLVGAELFVLTNQICTCDNKPAVDRRLGKPAPLDVNWSCRPTTSDERRGD